MPEAGLRTLTAPALHGEPLSPRSFRSGASKPPAVGCPGATPSGMGVAASPAPKRAAATGEPCARVRVRVHNPASGIAHLPASREWRPVLAPA